MSQQQETAGRTTYLASPTPPTSRVVATPEASQQFLLSNDIFGLGNDFNPASGSQLQFEGSGDSSFLDWFNIDNSTPDDPVETTGLGPEAVYVPDGENKDLRSVAVPRLSSPRGGAASVRDYQLAIPPDLDNNSQDQVELQSAVEPSYQYNLHPNGALIREVDELMKQPFSAHVEELPHEDPPALDIMTSAAAQKYLKKAQWRPASVDGVPRTDTEKLPFVLRIRDSMLNVEGAVDKTSHQGKRWVPGMLQMYPPKAITARAWQVLDEAVQLHESGCTIRSWSWARGKDNLATRGSKLDFTSRITRICEVLASRKMICSHLLDGQDHVIRALVADPEHSNEKSAMYKRSNETRASALAKAKAAMPTATSTASTAASTLSSAGSSAASSPLSAAASTPSTLPMTAPPARISRNPPANAGYMLPPPIPHASRSLLSAQSPQGVHRNTARRPPETLAPPASTSRSRDRRTAPAPITVPPPVSDFTTAPSHTAPRSGKRTLEEMIDFDSIRPSKSPRLGYNTTSSRFPHPTSQSEFLPTTSASVEENSR